MQSILLQSIGEYSSKIELLAYTLLFTVYAAIFLQSIGEYSSTVELLANTLLYTVYAAHLTVLQSIGKYSSKMELLANTLLFTANLSAKIASQDSLKVCTFQLEYLVIENIVISRRSMLQIQICPNPNYFAGSSSILLLVPVRMSGRVFVV